MVQHLPLTEARINLGAVLKRVRINKEYVVLEKDGIPIAGVMDIDEFEDYLEQKNPKIGATIRASAAEHRAGKSRPAEELLRELRANKQRRAPRRQSA